MLFTSYIFIMAVIMIRVGLVVCPVGIRQRQNSIDTRKRPQHRFHGQHRQTPVSGLETGVFYSSFGSSDG